MALIEKIKMNVVDFWNNRANLGEAAGTQDVILKRLEISELLKRVPFGSRVLDVGCGNGITLQALAKQNNCRGIGIDFAESMIQAAQASNIYDRISFQVCDITTLNLPDLPGPFDVGISERCLINLPDFYAQKRAFLAITDRLKPGGRYFMVENFYDGLVKLNALRALVGLGAMEPPWHNLYFHEDDIKRWESSSLVLEQVVPFTSTYYFLSRVVYARLAEDSGEKLRYESPINLLAPQLPVLGDVGATRLWVWRRVM